ncbi:hypothetical protein KGY77_10740, partial [Candidatus Bipolaricaulota bacterium]|nr:hypothetical protein [Candidatus Bipolaricaulota bacterium]
MNTLAEKYEKFKDWLFKVDGSSSRSGRSKSPEGFGKSEGIAHVNADRVFTYVNEGLLDCFGYDSPDELVNKDWKEVFGEEAAKL